MVNFAMVEPEINSALTYTGAGTAPALKAATHFRKAPGEIVLSGYRLPRPVAQLGGV
jgi:hypothetical protein